VVGRHKVIYSPGGGDPEQQEVPIEPGKHDESKPAPAVPFSGLVPKEPEVEVKAGSNEINIELVADSGAPAAPAAPEAPAEPAEPAAPKQ
jgi:hypothetical protein